MAALDVEKLLAPVSDEAPCGANLEYNKDFIEIEKLSKGTPEQTMGTTVIPAVEPDWRGVRDGCLELLAKTRDLRLLTFLTLSLLQLEGIPGLKTGLTLLKGSIEKFWDCIYPKLDPDDNNDPTARMNILRTFASRHPEWGDYPAVKMLRLAPLTQSVQAGRFSLRDIAVATGTTPPANPEAKIEMALIDAAAKDTNVDFLKANEQAAREAATLVKELEALIDAKVGAGRGVDLRDLAKTLKEAADRLTQFLGFHGVAMDNADTAGAGETSTDGAAAGGSPIRGDIQSQADVVRMLEKICHFYARTEPSSPVPILLERAKRLIGKNFWEILTDLSPSAIDSVKVISGTEGPKA